MWDRWGYQKEIRAEQCEVRKLPTKRSRWRWFLKKIIYKKLQKNIFKH